MLWQATALNDADVNEAESLVVGVAEDECAVDFAAGRCAVMFVRHWCIARARSRTVGARVPEAAFLSSGLAAMILI
ncbi:hypothetical protein [Actinomadura rudentiformis]|uniref:hypothetical protein n=1 Tax=Actinomadura rudentiformis TaxID=359158 RepID=UPI001CEF72C1|nr:hypothetical protein [Actinomadura rudentiformis]